MLSGIRSLAAAMHLEIHRVYLYSYFYSKEWYSALKYRAEHYHLKCENDNISYL